MNLRGTACAYLESSTNCPKRYKSLIEMQPAYGDSEFFTSFLPFSERLLKASP